MIIAYKAFDPDLSCTSCGHRFQYKTGIWNQEPAADCRKRGFHCAENPLDCLSYYRKWEHAVYYMVLADGDIDEDGQDSKISCTRLKLVKQLNLEEFIAHSLRYLMEHPKSKEHYLVSHDKGEARNGFAIVRGKEPYACGRLGDVLGLAKEEIGSNEISEIGLFVVDGKEILPDIWYDVTGKEIGGCEENEEKISA